MSYAKGAILAADCFYNKRRDFRRLSMKDIGDDRNVGLPPHSGLNNTLHDRSDCGMKPGLLQGF